MRETDYRRNQHGGMFGGLAVGTGRSSAIRVSDSFGRTLTRTLHACRALRCIPPEYHDPATVGNTRQQFPNNTIPTGAMDPVALLLDRYPLRPTPLLRTTTTGPPTKSSIRIRRRAPDRNRTTGSGIGDSPLERARGAGNGVSGRQRHHSPVA
jgi:hypothetical protein